MVKGGNEQALKERIEEMKRLHEKFLSFIENKDEDNNIFKELKDIMSQQKILRKPQKLKSFLMLILNICNNHYRSPEFFRKVEQVLKFLLLKQKFKQKRETFDIFASNKRILLFLFKEKIIKVDKKIAEYFLEEDAMHRNKYCHFFYPEVKDFLLKVKSNEIKKELLQIDPNYETSFDKKRLQGENENPLYSLIREDKIEEFIEYINRNKISLNASIEPSIYETNPYLISKNPSLIEYAAFFGSIDIFQHLYMNNVEIDEQRLCLYAIHSNNKKIFSIYS